mmetsp:Transcript_21547/g.39404  ORF Transcript_21547/g.39404 Transcript_21547/m.39404 type:complete len:268 (+) Transcript_21547:746-1549(+)
MPPQRQDFEGSLLPQHHLDDSLTLRCDGCCSDRVGHRESVQTHRLDASEDLRVVDSAVVPGVALHDADFLLHLLVRRDRRGVLARDRHKRSVLELGAPLPHSCLRAAFSAVVGVNDAGIVRDLLGAEQESVGKSAHEVRVGVLVLGVRRQVLLLGGRDPVPESVADRCVRVHELDGTVADLQRDADSVWVLDGSGEVQTLQGLELEHPGRALDLRVVSELGIRVLLHLERVKHSGSSDHLHRRVHRESGLLHLVARSNDDSNNVPTA